MTEKEISKFKKLFGEWIEALKNPYLCETGFQGRLADLKEKIADQKVFHYQEFLLKKALEEFQREIEND
jgi:hypothetical protein